MGFEVDVCCSTNLGKRKWWVLSPWSRRLFFTASFAASRARVMRTGLGWGGKLDVAMTISLR